jgi:nucleotide-binding universal stress UspA family protein
MTSTSIQSETAHSTELPRNRPTSALFAVVGFDGSNSSRAALDTAADVIRGRSGHLEVVFVAHVPAYVQSSAPALVGLRGTFSGVAAELTAQARTLLDDREPRWHFQRRDGSVTQQLVAAARELRSQHGPDATIVIIVGASTHLAHHLAVSVPVALTRQETEFPVLVVPSTPATPTPAADTSDYF